MADGFVKLLQMAVLPYVTVVDHRRASARCDVAETARARRCASRWCCSALWALALGFAFLMPLTFPPTQSASFFSTTLLEPPPPFNLVDLYIPANPFFALANNIVPAVVLFSMVVGVALIGLPRKQVLLDVLEAASDTLARAMRFVVAADAVRHLRHRRDHGRHAPARTGRPAGDLSGRLRRRSRCCSRCGCCPGWSSALTPIPARAIFAATREALLTAAIAGDLFIVLPVLIAACKELRGAPRPRRPHAAALPDVDRAGRPTTFRTAASCCR